MSSVKDKLKKDLELIENYLLLIQDSLSYIDEYGEVGLYDKEKEIEEKVNDSLSYIDEYGEVGLYDKEKEIEEKVNETLQSLSKSNDLLDNICDIVKEQYEY